MIPLAIETPSADNADSPDSWPDLGAGEIHVWRASLDEAARPDDREILSNDERARADAYRFEHDRRHYTTGRALLRRILARYQQRDPASLVFALGQFGKPRLVCEAGEDLLHFNVSHSAGVVVYAISREGPVGVDIERVREIPDWTEIAATVFPAAEQARLRGLPARWRMLGFFEAWTRQEAFLKATGEGLVGGNTAACARQAGYALCPLTCAPGYVASLASVFEPARVLITDWSDAPAGLVPLPDEN